MSTCKQCGFENTEDEQYCGGCGTSLAGRSFSLELSALAPALATGNKASALANPIAQKSRFEKIEVPAHALATPERRQLTVLFCDLVGSTKLSSTLDPEQWREILRRYQATCNHIVQRYDGYVARFVGDGIMVYFGYPDAHENDAERAILSAIEITSTVREIDPGYQGADPLAVRVGIATGLVVAGDLIGEGAAEQHAIVGQTPHVASRLHKHAGANEVVVADQTRRLVRNAANFSDLGPLQLDGIKSPVGAWRASAATQKQTGPSPARAPKDVMVGRSGQMLNLKRHWSDARRGHGQAIVLNGEAGIGKSRLSEELRRIADEDFATCVVYQCSPYHTATPLYPFLAHLEQAAEQARNEAKDSTRRRMWRDLIRDSDDSVSETFPIFNFLLDGDDRNGTTPGIPVQRNERTVAALEKLFERLTQTESVFVLIEDAQWMDPTSIEFVQSMLTRIKDRRAMVVINTRDSVCEQWHSLEHVHAVELETLSSGAAGQLVDTIAGNSKPDIFMREAIVERAGGNPLFIRELTRSLCLDEDANNSLTIPETLRELLSARLGRAGIERDIASVAAVIGRKFDAVRLARIAGCDDATVAMAVDALTDAGVIRPVSGNANSFVFTHSLIQDAAYDGLLLKRRRELHGSLADLLCSEPQTGAGSWVEIAWHYTRAERFSEAARYWSRAARDAFARASNREVIEHSENALSAIASARRDISTDRFEMRLQVLVGAANRALKGFASSEAEQAFARAVELGRKIDDPALKLDAIRGLFTCFYARGELNRAAEIAVEAREICNQSDNERFGAIAEFLDGALAFWRGEFKSARVSFEKALAVLDAAEDTTMLLSEQIDLKGAVLGHLGWTQWMMGEPAIATGTCEQALRITAATPQPFLAAMTLFWVCATNICMGNARVASQLLSQFSRVSKQHEYSYLSAVVMVLDGQTRVMQNQLVEGLVAMNEGLAAMRACNGGIGQPWVLSMVASAQARAGDLKSADLTAKLALKRCEKNGENHWRSEILRIRGEVALNQNRTKDAREWLTQSMQLAQEQGAKALELRARLSLSRLSSVPGSSEPTTRPSP